MSDESKITEDDIKRQRKALGRAMIRNPWPDFATIKQQQDSWNEYLKITEELERKSKS